MNRLSLSDSRNGTESFLRS